MALKHKLAMLLNSSCKKCIFVSQVDISTPMAYCMAPKEENELNIMKKACQATQDLFKNYLREQIMEIIDAEKV